MTPVVFVLYFSISMEKEIRMSSDGNRLREITSRVGEGELLTAGEESYLSGVIRKAQTEFESLHTRGVVVSPKLEFEGWRELQDILAADGQAFGDSRSLLEEAVRAREVYYQANYGLVRDVAIGYARLKGLNEDQIDELTQEGGHKLLRAIEMFDPGMGNRFSTYAYWWIRQGVMSGELKSGSDFTIPSRLVRELRRYRLLTKPTDEKGQEAMNDQEARSKAKVEMDDKTWLALKRIANARMVDLDETESFGEGEGDSVGDGVEDPNALDPEEVAYQNQRLDLVRALVREALSEGARSGRNTEIVLRRWGLHDGSIWTLEEVANEYGLTRERIRQIESRSINKVRGYVRRNNVKQEYFGDMIS